MSLVYTREPIEDGDIGVWAEKLLPQNRKSEGVLTANLYDASGDLRLKTGLIGYSNAAGFEQGASDDRGIILNDAELTISLALCSVSTWCKVTAEIVAGAAQIAVSDVSDSVDANELPTSFKDAFDGEKGGFYSGDLRIVGIAWRNAAGTLEGVVNCLSFMNGWTGYSQSDDANDIPYTFQKIIDDTTAIEKYNIGPVTPMLHLTYEVASGVSSGFPTSSAWTVAPQNTTIENSILGCTVAVSAMTVTLPPGTYEIEGFGQPCTNSANPERAQGRIRNTTDGSTIVLSRSCLAQPQSGEYFKGRFTLAAQKTIEYQYWRFYGTQCMASGSGENEKYWELIIKQLSGG